MNPKFLLPLVSAAFIASASAQTAAPPTGGTPAAPLRPQPAPRPFFQVGGFSFSAYLRSRIENYDFFEAPNGAGDSSYAFSGHQLRLAGVKSTPRLDLQFDLQGQLLTNLPDDASFQPTNASGAAVGPRVPLGLGGNYFAANGNQDGALNIKQGFVRFKGLMGAGSALRLGRFEFNDGSETVAKDATLNFLKTQRLSQRLIGTFGFTHTGRAFDGAQLSANAAGGNLTIVGARPTEGVFQLEANDNIDAVNFLYGAYTRPMPNAEARLFAMAYEDGRAAPKSVKIDNRPLAARQSDSEEIQVYTLGANFIKTFDADAGKFDVLGWGALQNGDWGTLDQGGNALALEAGFQPKTMKYKPWLRLGYYRASGDGNPTDERHNTFFTPLPTPRLYARFPFYNQMNSQDAFAQLILRPTPKLNIRAEAHSLKLANAGDLYYFGGGAFQDSGFGIGGRPSGGSKNLARVLDLSLDYALSAKSSLGLYLGHAAGGRVIETTYPNGRNATLGFVELTRRF